MDTRWLIVGLFVVGLLACGDGPEKKITPTGGTSDNGTTVVDAGRDSARKPASDGGSAGVDGPFASDAEPASRDTDSKCGDGVIDPGELCDGDCPTSCDSENSCVIGELVGSAATCDAECSSRRIDNCVDGDGCCPPGCSGADDDCSSNCLTCADIGATCGAHADNCGDTLDCGSCPAGESCDGTSCQPAASIPNQIGAPCQFNAECEALMGANAYCTGEDGEDGKCLVQCSDDSDCPSGSDCVSFWLLGIDTGEGYICRLPCSTANDCPDTMPLCEDNTTPDLRCL